jgi:hypothetical protein
VKTYQIAQTGLPKKKKKKGGWGGISMGNCYDFENNYSI